MDGRVTPRRPTGAAAQVTPRRVVDRSENHVAGRDTQALHLRVAFQAEIAVAFYEHLSVDGSVRDMAYRAPFTHRVVLVNMGQGLFVMASGARLIETRHGKSGSRRLHNIEAVWIVALHAIQLALEHGMALRQTQLGMDLQVAGKAGLRVLARIENEPPASATGGDVFAARPVA